MPANVVCNIALNKMEKYMFGKILIFIGCTLNIVWGIMHIINTIPVVNNFGNISIDNRNVITMEWINEGATLIFIGILVIIVTILTKESNKTLKLVYLISGIMMFILAIISFFTGFKIDFLPYKLCVPFFITSGILIFQGSLKK
jgi:hypothetical protein